MVEIVAEGTVEEVNGVNVEMIKTLPLLTIPLLLLLGATPSVVLAQSDSCTYRDRNKTLLIRRLPHVVARRAVVARQIDRSTTTGGRATDVGRGLPDHLGVMEYLRKSIVRLLRKNINWQQKTTRRF